MENPSYQKRDDLVLFCEQSPTAAAEQIDDLRREVEVWKQGHQVLRGTLETVNEERAELRSALCDLLMDGASIAERNHARLVLKECES